VVPASITHDGSERVTFVVGVLILLLRREVLVRYPVRPHLQRILPHLYALSFVLAFGIEILERIQTSPYSY
jgi:hypothetical protein